ncbi:MAG: alpha/beta hydrolase [Lachnospiraceae bacterium]|nr:alpha/beta hydrolase [Lachnospiraceae bacterium]
MTIVISGIVYFIIGMMQQYMVNSLKWTASAGLIVSLVFAFIVFRKKEEQIRTGSKQGKSRNLVLLIAYCLAVAMNLIGCFADTFAMLSILGITSFVMGIVLTAAGLVFYFKNGRSVALKFILPVLSIITFIGCGFFSLTTISPATTTSLLGPAIMGSSSSNVWEAEQTESVLEDGTRLISDIRYDDEIPNGYLDIYYTNENKFTDAPTFIFIHGGGYVWGDKVIGDPNMAKEGPTDLITTNFLAHGYNVVQMNYALAPEYQFPASIKQLNRGLKFLIDNGSDLGLDMSNVVLSGGSAGGNLAGLLVNIQTNPEYAKAVDESQAINPENIKAVYFLAALYDNHRFGVTGKTSVDWLFTQLGRLYLGTDEIKTDPSVKETNVIEYVTDSFPASFISDGNTGTFYDQAFDMYNKLRNLGVDSEICYFPPQEATLNHGHEGNDTEYSKMMYQRLFEFLSKYVVSQ